MSIQQRKKDHVDLTVNKDVFYRKPTGFEKYDLIHDALPEVNPEKVDTEATLFGRRFAMPLFISSMTGGYTDAGNVNSIIAKVCEELNIPFGVGSQRAMLEDESQTESFSVVRDYAPNAFIAANIGGAQLIGGMEEEKMERLIESIRADAVIIHLNPLQELMQPEGDHDFEGIESGITQFVTNCDLPVIVKETGAGITGPVARRLLSVGVESIDVAGAGGTSWAKVENLRERQTNPRHLFDDWGVPTVECIRHVNELKETFRFELIASGGIRTSIDMVKAMALGADFCASAQPVIKAIAEGGEEGLKNLLNNWRTELKLILTLLGCRTVQELSGSHLRLV
ncbi:MAG: type 2 isopentenyl-diphosphate Delta-isomerase [Balneolaceae bacterium]|nr:type 2 isopentenyl-diphosphate Delta-isomerase [Balneolaceae bacterium]MCH8549735.1 type 2 isopentenyl-diphosphate Delta-isomerase [Balneolaceae bacterium]